MMTMIASNFCQKQEDATNYEKVFPNFLRLLLLTKFYFESLEDFIVAVWRRWLILRFEFFSSNVNRERWWQWLRRRRRRQWLRLNLHDRWNVQPLAPITPPNKCSRHTHRVYLAQNPQTRSPWGRWGRSAKLLFAFKKKTQRRSKYRNKDYLCELFLIVENCLSMVDSFFKFLWVSNCLGQQHRQFIPESKKI